MSHQDLSAAAGGKSNSVALSKEALDFAPGLLAIQESPPGRLPRAIMFTVTALLVLLLLWAIFGRLDIIASAEGKLVPRSYLKVVQPADRGIVKEILVHEGQHVTAGQILLRMDAQDAQADTARIRTQLRLRSLQLRRIDAELAGGPLREKSDDPQDLFRQVEAQYREHRQTYLDELASARDQLGKAKRDYESGQAVLKKLSEINPILKSQAEAYASLGGDGYVPKVTVNDKRRAYLENNQDLDAQESTVQGLADAVSKAEQQMHQVTSKYRSNLDNERIDAEGEYRKLKQELAKELHHSSLLELKSPQDGTVKDLATHTIGTVVSAGTVLLSIVPDEEPLVAEVMIKNDDVGFVHAHQKVKVKLAAYPFQKYGMLDGDVQQVWPDATESGSSSSSGFGSGGNGNAKSTRNSGVAGFKALIALDGQKLMADGESFNLVAGMQVIAEIHEGRRTVLDYLLSPLQSAIHDSGRER